MLALFAECQGFAGIVIDGPATDSIAIEKSGFPVFCTGISVVTTMSSAYQAARTSQSAVREPW